MKKILLIEDDFYILDIYKQILIGGGFEVDTALDGSEGLKKISEVDYDMILIDIMLPGTNGLMILKAARENYARAKHTPIFMLTNLGKENIIKEAFKIGADGYLIKAQIKPQYLLNEINTFFAQKEKGKAPTTPPQST